MISSARAADAGADQLPVMFQRYRADIDDALRAGLSRGDIPVYDMLRYYMGWVDVDGNPCEATQGKALRPTLCLFGCEAVGGSAGSALPAAVALEFIHNCSLVHDDIQDEDETRHHRLTLWAAWDVPRALQAGNVLRVVADRALERLLDGGMDYGQAVGIARMLTGAYLDMIEGQWLDISYEGRRDIAIDDYMVMISKKTGSLIRCSLDMGVAIGTTDEAAIRAFRSFGRSVGYAFQIRDDSLGVWGEEEATGKPVGADIRRKKNSLPIVYTMARADGADRRELERVYGKDGLDDGDVSIVLDVMERVDARGFSQRLAERHCASALDAVAGVEMAATVREEIEELVQFLLVRER
jgi:geranylgeranyl diphosphate synthase type I